MKKNIKHKPRLRLRFAETTITDVITILAGFFLVWSLFPFQHGPQLSLSCTVDCCFSFLFFLLQNAAFQR